MENNKILQTAIRVVEDQKQGVLDLLNKLNDTNSNLSNNFVKVCNLLYAHPGKVILSGVGKSGHIATKIASTLASTGTPAFFVHPTEALHGDLGMIKNNDIIMLFSNSGNSIELNGILQYANRFNINTIAITKNSNSELAKNSTVVLEIPSSKEACVLGLAPTTSTTITLVLGDAIAITLLEMRGFSKDDFKIFHPGGSLGSKLLKVENIMHKNLEIPLVSNSVTMKEAILEITKHRFGCVGVLNNNKLVGIITDGDIRRNMDDNFLHKNVSEVMNTSFVTLSLNTHVEQALLIMNSKKITNCFVIDNSKVVGVLHIHDLLNYGTR